MRESHDDQLREDTLLTKQNKSNQSNQSNQFNQSNQSNPFEDLSQSNEVNQINDSNENPFQSDNKGETEPLNNLEIKDNQVDNNNIKNFINQVNIENSNEKKIESSNSNLNNGQLLGGKI